jgi:hypothetical protein
MYFPLYKQVVLSEETVFNEGEGDTDPQALHNGIHLLRSLPRTRKITYFFLPHHLFIKRKVHVGIFAFRHILTEL